MPNTMLPYPLSSGFIHHWLAAGPVTAAAAAESPEIEVTQPVVDLGMLNEQQPGVRWRYYRSLADHWVDLTAFYPAPAIARAWAFTALDCPADGEGRLVLALAGCTADVWVNGAHALRLEPAAGQRVQTAELPSRLASGRNEVLVRLTCEATRETPIRMAMRMQGWSDDQAAIVLPTNIEPDLLEMRQRLESIAEAAFLDRYVYGYLGGDRYDQNEAIIVRYPDNLPTAGELTHRLQSLGGDIFQETTRRCQPGMVFDMARTFPLRNGPHHLAWLPTAKEYYIKNLQFERKDVFHVVRSGYSAQPMGTAAERTQPAAEQSQPAAEQSQPAAERAPAALEDAALRRNDSLYCEMAKMSLGRWDKLNPKALQGAVERITQRLDGSVYDLLGMLGILARFGEDLPDAEMKTRFEACALGCRYWHDQPGSDGMDFTSEQRQIAHHTCEILAGQLFSDRTFTNSGQSGDWHRQHGEALALAWIQARGTEGFREWDSPAGIEIVLAALAHLADLAETDNLREMAVVLMDKVLFGLALSSWRGLHGASHGYADPAGVLSPRLQPTAGICRLMWGQGNYNESVMGTVSLALCEAYELPGPIEHIATAPPSAEWTRQRSRRPETGWEANRVTYRTQDFMLSSVQDYQPGQMGQREQVWLACLGPDAVVFSNHPANLNVETAQEPNLWAGNGVLPRAAQWGDVLIAVYQIPEEDWMGYTHAYFPAHAFDEVEFAGQWAFARKGNGYLALFAAQGLDWVQGGKTALRELHSPGRNNVWICHMGQAVLDGTFANFREKILAMEIETEPQRAAFTNLRGDRLSFGWEGPLLVNGEEQDLSGFPHYESPFANVAVGAAEMDIIYQDEGIRLKFV